MRLLENDKLRQEETNREAYHKGDNVSADIAGHGKAFTQWQHFFAFAINDPGHEIGRQDVVIADKEQQKPEHGHTTATGNIAKSLDRYPSAEGRMEEIDHFQDNIPGKIKFPAVSIMLHRSAKVRKMLYF